MTIGIFIGVIVSCIFIASFCLFRLGSDDIVLIRKGISLEELFNLAFFCGFIGLLVGVLAKSFIFSILAGIIAITFFARRKRFPIGRIADIFSVTVLCAVPVSFFAFAFFQHTDKFLYLFSAIFSLFLFLFFLIILFPKTLRGDLKDGSLTFLFLVNVLLLAFLQSVFKWVVKNTIAFSFQDGATIGAFIITLALFVEQEKKLLTRIFKKGGEIK